MHHVNHKDIAKHELLPCPFCGGAGMYFPYTHSDDASPWIGVGCGYCEIGFDMPITSWQSAANAWNTRAQASIRQQNRLADVLAKGDTLAIYLQGRTHKLTAEDAEWAKIHIPSLREELASCHGGDKLILLAMYKAITQIPLPLITQQLQEEAVQWLHTHGFDRSPQH